MKKPAQKPGDVSEGHQDKHLEELIEIQIELQRDTFAGVFYLTSVFFVAGMFLVGLTWPRFLSWQFWVVFVIFAACFRITQTKLNRAPIASGIFWLFSLMVVVFLIVFLFNLPEGVWILAFLPFLAVMMLNWQLALIFEIMIALVFWITSTQGIATAFQDYIPVVLAGGFFGGMVAWISRKPVLDSLQSADRYYQLAQESLKDAQEHRAQLVAALKNLDLAYYRLERANATLVSAWKKAEEAEKFKTDFVTYVSHEMRTPLNLISGFSEMILTAPESYKGRPLPGEYREDISKILRSANHLLKLVDDIIDLAKVNVGRISLMREKFDLNSLAVEAISMVRDYIQARGLEIRLETANESAIIYADRLRILQVLLNLLVNAVRFTEKGWIRLRIDLTASFVRVTVEDTGKGIAAENLENVFEEYYTSQQPGQAWHGGGGLGLPISKKLIELHQGKIGVSSTPGKGTTFWFEIPIEEPEQKQTFLSRPYKYEHFLPRNAEQALLVLHRDPYVAPVIQRYMENYRVISSQDPAESLELARQNKAVAILTPLDGFTIPSGEDFYLLKFPLPDWHHTFPWPFVRDVLRKPVSTEDILKAIRNLPMFPESILVIEDDMDMIDLFRRILLGNFNQEQIQYARSGADAFEIIFKAPPELILLDLLLPDMDGRQILERLASDFSLPALSVLIVSGNVEDYAQQKLDSTLEIRSPAGFQLGQVVRLTQVILDELTPGWEQPRDAKHQEAKPG
jgi:signal transduction histidine kinase/CheY-like chemotaxis protein